MEALARVSAFLKTADAVLIGAGAGLSEAAGLEYAGEAFRREFADYIAKYGFTDLYSSGFYPYPTEEERWARWARHVDFMALRPPAMPLYRQLLRLVTGAEYFVITTNVDAQFEKAGFDLERLFAVQGDYREMQCARACHKKVYSTVEAVRKMLAASHDLTMPPQFVPRCPVCGGTMEMHLRVDEYFIEDAAWHEAARRYAAFLQTWGRKRLLLLELGVGFNTPTIIRYPFEELAFFNKDALLVRMNREDAPPRLPIQARTISLTAPMPEMVERLLVEKTKSAASS